MNTQTNAESASKGIAGPECATRHRRSQFRCDGHSPRCWDHLGLDAAATPGAHPHLLCLVAVSPRTATGMELEAWALWWPATSWSLQPTDTPGSSGAQCRNRCLAGNPADTALCRVASSKQRTHSSIGLCQQSEPRKPAFPQNRAVPRGDMEAKPRQRPLQPRSAAARGLTEIRLELHQVFAPSPQLQERKNFTRSLLQVATLNTRRGLATRS